MLIAALCHRYDYTFYDRLKIDPKEHKIMLTEAAMNPKKVRVHSAALPPHPLLGPKSARFATSQ